jgi:hypothetical protein
VCRRKAAVDWKADYTEILDLDCSSFVAAAQSDKKCPFSRLYLSPNPKICPFDRSLIFLPAVAEIAANTADSAAQCCNIVAVAAVECIPFVVGGHRMSQFGKASSKTLNTHKSYSR